MALFILAAVSLILLAAPFTSRAFEPASPTAGAPAPANQPIEATTPPHVEETKVPAYAPTTQPPTTAPTNVYDESSSYESPIAEIKVTCNREYYQGWDERERTVEIGTDPETGEAIIVTYPYYDLSRDDLELTVSMRDGTEIKGNGYYVESQLTEILGTNMFEYNYDTYQFPPEAAWHLGENRCTMTARSSWIPITISTSVWRKNTASAMSP